MIYDYDDLGFGRFAFKLLKLLNTNLPTVGENLVRANIFFSKWAPNLVPNRAMNLEAQLGPMSITKALPLIGLAKWASAPFISLNFCCLGLWVDLHQLTPVLSNPQPEGRMRPAD